MNSLFLTRHLSFVGLVFALSACGREREPEPEPSAPRLAPPPPLLRTGFQPTRVSESKAPRSAPSGMVWIPGGEYSMGSSDPTLGGHCHEPMDDARPIHRVSVSGFFMDRTEVTNRSFAEFVERDGVRDARREDPDRRRSCRECPKPIECPVRRCSRRLPGTAYGSISHSPGGASCAARAGSTREGPLSTIEGREEHPVVHMRLLRRGRLRALGGEGSARPKRSGSTRRAAGDTGKLYPWGDELTPEAASSPTPTRARSRSRQSTALGRLRGQRAGAVRSRRTLTASTTWPATSGSGRATGTAPTSTSDKLARGVVRDPRGPEHELRSQRSPRRRSACSERLVPVHERLLHALHGRYSGQGRAQFSGGARRVSLRAARSGRVTRLTTPTCRAR